MDVIVFSDIKNTASIFEKIEKAKSFKVSYHALAELKKNYKLPALESIIYADLSNQAPAAVKKYLAILSSLKTVFGIIDSKGSFIDPIVLVHSGASDYIGKTQIKQGIDSARIKRAFDFGKRYLPAEPVKSEEKTRFNSPLSGKDWKAVQSGKAYTFCFMYIELDNQKYIKKRFMGPHLEEFTRRYQDFIQKSVADINGRIWMWTDLGGLILFPFDGEGCPAVVKSISMMLDRGISSFEQFDYDILLSFRMALHIGDTVYQSKGNTGKIISDSINSIHHLKQNFAEPGHLYLTEVVKKYVPQGLEKFFVSAGNYEGREIFRLRDFNNDPPIIE